MDSHTQANGGAKVVRVAGPADNLSRAGARHVQGARDILQGRQASVLFYVPLQMCILELGLPASLSLKLESRLFISSMQT